MRLVTFNVLHGRSLTDGRVDGARFEAIVASLDADVLAMQEVDRGQVRSGGLDLARIAAEAMGAVAWWFAAAAVERPGQGWRAATATDAEGAGAAYGVALLSRYPVSSWYEVRLPALPVRSPVFLPGSGRVQLLPDEPRVALVAVLQTPAGVMTVAATHLSFVPGWNAAQLTGLVHRMRQFPRPLLLLGDLNLPGALPRLLTGWRPLAGAATFPAPDPRLQIDHVLGWGPLPRVRSACAPHLAISDHRPLVVDLAT